ncbi:hypothetical protein [Bosea sp. (in: a-proteobacteria)]|uniref:hypothetical protein n=1 Tax=Bosea sp. (in: a-proteobacteria) TaxID=1871050 RepID=UPI002FC71556
MESVSGTGAIWATRLLLLLAVFCLALAPPLAWAAPAPLPKRPALAASFARACTIALPETPPLFGSNGASASKEDEPDAEDEADDDDDDDDDDGDPPERGLILPGSGTCLSLSGTVSAGLQRDSYKVSRNSPPAPSATTTFPTSAAFRIATSHELASGLRVGSAFGFTLNSPVDGVSETTLDEATILIGPWTFGLDTSRFSFWTGDEFIFSTRAPSRTVGLIALELPLTASWTATLSLEDTALGNGSATNTASGATTTPSVTSLGPGRSFPDGVARLVYEAGDWTVHGALALREAPSSSSRLGRAGILGVTYESELFGATSSLTAQIAGGIDAAPYIGSQLDGRLVNRVLLGTDPTRGFSALVSTRREWTDEIATNAFISRYWLAVPLAGQVRGEIRIDRVAANLVWTPVEGFKAGIESSVAWARIALSGREIQAGLAGRQISTQLFVERSF